MYSTTSMKVVNHANGDGNGYVLLQLLKRYVQINICKYCLQFIAVKKGYIFIESIWGKQSLPRKNFHEPKVLRKAGRPSQK